MKKILLFSDSHGKNTDMIKIIEKEKADYVIHAGDFCTNIEFMEKNFSYYVAGNNDYEGENELIFEIEKVKFVLVHGHLLSNCFFNKEKNNEIFYRFLLEKKADVLLYGHSHIEFFLKYKDKYFINPGSITLPRNIGCTRTYFIFHVNEGKIVEQNLDEVFRSID